MAASWNILQRELESILKLKQSENFSDFSDKFSTAFSRSTLNIATTSFGQPLIYGNYNSIKTAIKLFLDFNRNIEANIEKLNQSVNALNKAFENINQNFSEIELPENTHPLLKSILRPKIQEINKQIKQSNQQTNDELEKIKNQIEGFKKYIDNLNVSMVPYIFLEYSFISFWLTCKFSSLPPIPPTVAPLFGTVVIVPGIPGILSVAFKSAFTSKDPSNAAIIITEGIKSHAATVSGTYSGLIPSPAGTLPSPPIPWIGVI